MPEQHTDRAQTAQGNTHLVHTFGARFLLCHSVVAQEMVPAGRDQQRDDIINGMLGRDVNGFASCRRLHDIE
ncbi:hypothetical protein RZA33_019820, partial [Halovibrio sp. HP20-59]